MRGIWLRPVALLFSNELACLRLVGTGTARQSLAYTCGEHSWKWEAQTKPQQRNLKAENRSNHWTLGPFINSTDISFMIYLWALNTRQRVQNVWTSLEFFTCHDQTSKCVAHKIMMKRKSLRGISYSRREKEIFSHACSPSRVLGQETSSLSLRPSRRTKMPGVTSKFWHLVGRPKPSNDLCLLPSDPVHDVPGRCTF